MLRYYVSKLMGGEGFRPTLTILMQGKPADAILEPSLTKLPTIELITIIYKT